MSFASRHAQCVLAADENFSFVSTGQLTILLSLRPESAASLRLIEEQGPTLAARTADFGLLFCALHDKPPPREFVPTASRLLVASGPRLLRVGVAIERTGFVAAAQRSITTAVILARSSPIRSGFSPRTPPRRST